MKNTENIENELFKKMKQDWGGRIPGRIDMAQAKEFAVLIPLIKKEGNLEILFEVRASSLHRQPGEICFPGGKAEENEAMQETALRETMEELGAAFEQIEILAPLDLLETPDGSVIYPYLGVLHDYRATYSPDEVERVFSVPLQWFIEHDPKGYTCEIRTIPEEEFPYEWIPGGRNYPWRRGSYKVYFYHYEEEIIWGMTAKILYSFVKMYRKQYIEEEQSVE